MARNALDESAGALCGQRRPEALPNRKNAPAACAESGIGMWALPALTMRAARRAGPRSAKLTDAGDGHQQKDASNHDFP
jgi:hypothetical protein